MELRRLRLKDAPYMLEWMHDRSVATYLQADFLSKDINDCEEFIRTSLVDKENLHLAIADDTDTYMGTVSLKDMTGATAEFAITVRSCAMGKGYSRYAMERIIRLGLKKIGLQYIYWYVRSDNARAIRFYDKNGYQRVDRDDIAILGDIYTRYADRSYLWYMVSDRDM